MAQVKRGLRGLFGRKKRQQHEQQQQQQQESQQQKPTQISDPTPTITTTAPSPAPAATAPDSTGGHEAQTTQTGMYFFLLHLLLNSTTVAPTLTSRLCNPRNQPPCSSSRRHSQHSLILRPSSSNSNPSPLTRYRNQQQTRRSNHNNRVHSWSSPCPRPNSNIRSQIH